MMIFWASIWWVLLGAIMGVIAIGVNKAFPACQDPQCNCRWGLSYCTLGLFVIAAATGFLLVGFLIWGFNFESTPGYDEYHAFNLWWYKLGAMFVGVGLILLVVIKDAAKAREPKEVPEEHAAEKGSDSVSPPTPYVMLKGEP